MIQDDTIEVSVDVGGSGWFAVIQTLYEQIFQDCVYLFFCNLTKYEYIT